MILTGGIGLGYCIQISYLTYSGVSAWIHAHTRRARVVLSAIGDIGWLGLVIFKDSHIGGRLQAEKKNRAMTTGKR